MNAAEQAAAARRGVGLFAPADRGLLAVRGSDRERWLDGMLSNRIAGLAPGPSGSGCYALLLTPQARIVADLHVLARDGEFWLETSRAILPTVQPRLERYIVSEDVKLEDRSAETARLALEGARAAELLARVAETAPAPAPDCGVDVVFAGTSACVASWGYCDGAAFQLILPASGVEAVRGALLAAGAELGLVEGDAQAHEVLRIEAGVPALGAELSEDVLPAEAGLVGSAVSTSKGCYTGQEIVARMASRGQAGHRLVGLRLDGGDELPAPGSEVEREGRRIGELTSACRSALVGAIGLAYVRRGHETPGTPVDVGGAPARVAELPFVVGSA